VTAEKKMKKKKVAAIAATEKPVVVELKNAELPKP